MTERGQLADPELMQKAGQGMALGVQTIEMGVLGGIITGIIVYNLHKKFYNIQLSDSFAFFGGSRFVPIITALIMALVGLAIPVIWPLFALLIQQVGNLIQRAGIFGPFLFSLANVCFYPLVYITFLLQPFALLRLVEQRSLMDMKFTVL